MRFHFRGMNNGLLELSREPLLVFLAISEMKVKKGTDPDPDPDSDTDPDADGMR